MQGARAPRAARPRAHGDDGLALLGRHLPRVLDGEPRRARDGARQRGRRGRLRHAALRALDATGSVLRGRRAGHRGGGAERALRRRGDDGRERAALSRACRTSACASCCARAESRRERRDVGRGGLPRGARAAGGREPAHRRRRRLGRRARTRRGARARRPPARLARPAARRPLHGQGPERRDAVSDDLRLARVRRATCPSDGRRLHRAPAPRRRRADRQDEHARDGHAADDREPALRRHAQPARPRAHAGRLERRRGSRARGRHRHARTGLRRRRLDPHPRGVLRRRRPQADARARERRARELRLLGGLRDERPDGAHASPTAR